MKWQHMSSVRNNIIRTMTPGWNGKKQSLMNSSGRGTPRRWGFVSWLVQFQLLYADLYNDVSNNREGRINGTTPN